MYPILLSVHGILRWAVLLLGIWALVSAYSGWLGKRPWSMATGKARTFYVASLDLQLLLGLVLYFFLSPFTTGAFDDFGATMKAREPRFFAMEHLLLMLIALVTAHIGAAKSKNAPDPVTMYKRLAIWFTISMIGVLLGIPWWRPLLRGLGG